MARKHLSAAHKAAISASLKGRGGGVGNVHHYNTGTRIAAQKANPVREQLSGRMVAARAAQQQAARNRRRINPVKPGVQRAPSYYKPRG